MAERRKEGEKNRQKAIFVILIVSMFDIPDTELISYDVNTDHAIT